MYKQRIMAILKEMKNSAMSIKTYISIVLFSVIPLVLSLLGDNLKIKPLKMMLIFMFSVLVLYLFILCWKLSRYAAGNYSFDRKYRLKSTSWKFDINNDRKTLSAECVGERRMVCTCGQISKMVIALSPFENFIPFDPNFNYEVQLIEKYYINRKGEITINEPHRKSDSNFAFQINFNPPLTEGDEVYVKYRFVIGKYKIATLNYLRELAPKAQREARDCERTIFQASYPIEELITDLHFTQECRILPIGIEAKRFGLIDQNEMKVIKEKKYYSENNNDGWILHFDRKNPPIKTTYRISWKPPLEKDILSDSDESL